jgi:death-on-curing protein
MDPRFIDYDEAVAINVDQVSRYGGCAGVRDEGLLLSALAMPQAAFGEQWAHADLYEMAAAYLFHIVKNRPFIDGNKRVGAVAARVFLRLNGIELTLGEDAAYDLVIATAEGRADKTAIAAAFRENSRKL